MTDETKRKIGSANRAIRAAKRGGISLVESCRNGKRRWYLKNRKRVILKGQIRYRDNPSAFKQYKRDWYQQNKERILTRKTSRDHGRRYGLKPGEYETRLSAQNGVCAICAKPSPIKSRLAVDHCHATGFTRGILCVRCNAGLGAFDDSVYLLLKAVAYLAASQEKLA